MKRGHRSTFTGLSIVLEVLSNRSIKCLRYAAETVLSQRNP